MYDDLLKRLTTTGRTEFTATEIQAEMNKMFDEEMDRMEQSYLKDHPEMRHMEKAENPTPEQEDALLEAIAYDHMRRYYDKQAVNEMFAPQPTSWAQAAKDIELPARNEPSGELER